MFVQEKIKLARGKARLEGEKALVLRESELMMAGGSRAHRWNRMLPEVATMEERPNIGKTTQKDLQLIPVKRVKRPTTG